MTDQDPACRHRESQNLAIRELWIQIRVYLEEDLQVRGCRAPAIFW